MSFGRVNEHFDFSQSLNEIEHYIYGVNVDDKVWPNRT